MRIVGFSGAHSAGKDAAANVLVESLGFTRMAFAGPIKDGLSAMFAIPREWFDDREKKDQVVPWLGVTLRKLMQVTAEEYAQDMILPGVWARIADMRLDAMLRSGGVGPGVVFSDMYREEAANMIRWRGGVVVHVFRGGVGAQSEHCSENGVRVEPGDMILHNDGTLDDLAGCVRQIPMMQPTMFALRCGGASLVRVETAEVF